MNRTSTHTLALCLLLSGACLAAAADAVIRFEKLQLDDRFRSEGVAVGDFNRDGSADIAAGFVWYSAPDWKMHVISAQPPSASKSVLGSPPYFDPQGYSNSFCNFAHDCNQDGWLDLIVVDFPGTPTWWFENPRGVERSWQRHLCTPVTNNESPALLDLDGDGRPELVAAFSPDPQQPDGPDRQMAFLTPDADPYQPWQLHPISVKGSPGARRYSHGLGVGDLNGDGRLDILCADGWWSAPASRAAPAWQFHEAPFGQRTPNGEGRAAQLLVHDFDNDGDSDVLASSPHAFGIWWHEQVDGRFRKHLIDRSFSQTHAVCLADVNGDGLPDFVTGKRWWAHGGRDPGGDQPAVFYWFELQHKAGRPYWTRHQFDNDSGPGTQFQVADVNGDSWPDVVSSNKKGVCYFRQVREP